MPAQKKVFGSPVQHTGKVQSALSTHVPVELLAQLKPRKAIPCTITTSAFRLDGGANARIPVWNGKDYFELQTTSTWNQGSTSAVSFSQLNATTGVKETATAMTTGIYYMYAGITGTTDTDYAIELLPSKVAPTPTGSGEFNSGWYIHPGTAKENYWNYVGWLKVATAGDADTAAVFTAATKRGYWYEFASVDVSGTSSDTSSSATADFSASIPVHECEASGYITKSGDSAHFYVAATSFTDTTVAGLIAVECDATNYVTAPFTLTPDTAGALYMIQDQSTACRISISRVKDVV